jgi:anti-sigma-K factor RskA
MGNEARTEAHVIDQLPAYALGCLDPEEQQRTAAHLEQCSACRDELRAYEAVVGQMAFAAPEASPPQRLKDAILQQALGSSRRQRSETPVEAGVPPSRSFSDQLAFFFASLGRGRMPAWGLVSLALIAILAVSNLLLWQQTREPSAPEAGSFRVVELTADETDSAITGLVVISPDGRYGTLVVNGLDVLPLDKQYQLWLAVGDRRDSGGVFSVSRSGYGALEISAPQPLREYARVGITIEPSGGSPGPTGDRVLGGDL